MSSKLVLALTTSAFIHAAAVSAANIDMDDPRRALGREGDVRVDAQLLRDTITAGAPVGITYRIQNMSASSVAIAHKVTDAGYDEDTGTISIAVGAEVPPDGDMPQMTLIGPGETKVLTTAATPRLSGSARASLSKPRYVQLRVAILRDVRPFLTLIQKQDGRARQQFPDELFDKWFECNDTIVLNTLPVYFQQGDRSNSAEHRDARGSW